MSDEFIPIDSSNLPDIIPEHEDILYSTLCKGTFEKDSILRKKWKTHLLMTYSGLFFLIPEKNIPPRMVFYPWHKIRQGKRKASLEIDGILIRPTYHPEFESKRDFINRLEQFSLKCKSFLKIKPDLTWSIYFGFMEYFLV